eukprot:TRINITY_DN23895_c0_g1_i1.p1 TRINITY_DN23895_c0_g1~~TRINITY_DN23895_c0_g1_i1.p1  ORF type:complete len:234 (-),score=9.02 TRINITY_DN23895_c0_g1_i1:53-754(-)
MSSQAFAWRVQAHINLSPTNGGQAICVYSPELRQGKSSIHFLPTTHLRGETKRACWRHVAGSAGAWEGCRAPEIVAVAYSCDAHRMMRGGLSILPKSERIPTAVLRPRPMSNNFLGRQDQSHGQSLLEIARAYSDSTDAYFTKVDVEYCYVDDEDSDCFLISDDDWSKYNLITPTEVSVPTEATVPREVAFSNSDSSPLSLRPAAGARPPDPPKINPSPPRIRRNPPVFKRKK